MKALMTAAVVAGAIAVGALSGTPVKADTFSFSFDPGGVAYAYNDGWWDHDHHWHRWHNARESREFRERYADHYHAWRHDRDRDMGWHEEH